MLSSIKSLVLFAVMTYSVSATSVAAPKCGAHHKVTRRDCTNALSSYIADKHGFVDQNKKDNQKSCGECQIHVYTSDGSNLRFTMKGAQAALESVLRSCGNGYGSVSIAEDLMPGMRVSPTVLSVEKGSGRSCGSSPPSVAAPKCVARNTNTVTRRDCTNALSSYIADKHGFVDQNKKDNQKSCGECQIHVYTSDGSNLRFTMKGAQEALDSVLRSCGNGYGSVSIAEDLMPGMRVSPTVLSVEKGSGRSCGSSPPSVAAPKCVARNTNTVTRRDCTNALSTYQADKHGFVDQNKKDNQKSCGECQIHVYTSDGSNLRFTMEGAQKALDSVLRSCGNGYGSVRIAEDLMPGMRVSPTVLSVEKGSGRFCGLLRDN